MGASIVSDERVTIRARWSALNPPLIVAGAHSRVLPRPVIDHRTFDGKDPPIVIDDDEEERLGLCRH